MVRAAQGEECMIYVLIRVYETYGQWRLYELGVADNCGMSQHVLRPRVIYKSEQEAITIAKYEALMRIEETWGSVPMDQITWHIETMTHPPEELAQNYPSSIHDFYSDSEDDRGLIER
jgi:hypothetical protein